MNRTIAWIALAVGLCALICVGFLQKNSHSHRAASGQRGAGGPSNPGQPTPQPTRSQPVPTATWQAQQSTISAGQTPGFIVTSVANATHMKVLDSRGNMVVQERAATNSTFSSTVAINRTQAFRLFLKRSNGSWYELAQQVTVTVGTPPQPRPGQNQGGGQNALVINNFQVTPWLLPHGGGDVTVRWDVSTNATRVRILDAGRNPLHTSTNASGSWTHRFTVSQEIILEVQGAGGQLERTAQIRVGPRVAVTFDGLNPIVDPSTLMIRHDDHALSFDIPVNDERLQSQLSSLATRLQTYLNEEIYVHQETYPLARGRTLAQRRNDRTFPVATLHLPLPWSGSDGAGYVTQNAENSTVRTEFAVMMSVRPSGYVRGSQRHPSQLRLTLVGYELMDPTVRLVTATNRRVNVRVVALSASNVLQVRIPLEHVNDANELSRMRDRAGLQTLLMRTAGPSWDSRTTLQRLHGVNIQGPAIPGLDTLSSSRMSGGRRGGSARTGSTAGTQTAPDTATVYFAGRTVNLRKVGNAPTGSWARFTHSAARSTSIRYRARGFTPLDYSGNRCLINNETAGILGFMVQSGTRVRYYLVFTYPRQGQTVWTSGSPSHLRASGDPVVTMYEYEEVVARSVASATIPLNRR